MFDLDIRDAVGWLRLSRPEARNAIPLDGWARLAEAAQEAAAGGARALILAGIPGGAFCAGADIADFDRLQSDPAARTAFRKAIRYGLDTLRSLEIPTIALVEGACFGAGVALAMACDIRIAGNGARFAITPAKLGISYPQEDVYRLVSLVGPGQAARLLFSAETIDGLEAARIGLVEIHSDTAEDRARSLAEAIAANEPQSIAALKASLRLDVEQHDGQDRVFEDLFGSEELSRRLEAYRSRAR